MQADKSTAKRLNRAQRRRREDIIQAALEIFDRDGFEAARIKDVADAAEIAKGTVYLYFPTKQALLEGVIYDVVGPEVAAVEKAAADSARSASDRLRQQIRIIGQRLGSGHMKIILRLMICEGPRHDTLRRYYYENVVARGMTAIAKCLADGEASGEFQPGAAAIKPQVFAGTTLLIAVWQMLFEDLAPLEVERVLEQHLEVVLDGITA